MRDELFIENMDNLRKKNYLKRSRINELLDPREDETVILLCADSGYGKTRAMQDYITTQNAYIYWIHFTEYDNYAPRFWTRFTDLLNTNIKKDENKILVGDFPVQDITIHKFIAEFNSKLPLDKPSIFVFDDFHKITNSSIGSLLIELIFRSESNIRYYVLSRISLEDVTSFNKVRTITSSDLTFTLKEAEDFFQQKEMNISYSLIKDIYLKTKGWPFAIYLASLGSTRQEESLQLQTQYTNRYIFEIIDEVIFSKYPQELQTLLVSLAFNQVYPVQMVKDLFANETDQHYEILANNIFIRYDPSKSQFLCHDLFHEFLQTKQTDVIDEKTEHLLTLVGEWYQSHNLFIDAINAFKKAKKYKKIWRIILEIVPGYHDAEVGKLLLECISLFPSSFIAEHPLTEVVKAALYSNMGDFHTLKKLSLDLINKLNKEPISVSNREAIGNAYINVAFSHMKLGSIQFKNDFKTAAQYLDKKSRIYGKPYLFMLNGNPIVLLEGKKQEVDDFITALDEAEPYYTKLLNGGLHGLASLAKAISFYYQCKFTQAEAHVFTAIHEGKQRKQHDIVLSAYFLSIRLAIVNANYLQTKELMSKMKKYNDKYNTKSSLLLQLNILDTALGAFYCLLDLNENIPEWIMDDKTYTNTSYNRNIGFEGIIKVVSLFNEDKYDKAAHVLKMLEYTYKKTNDYIYLAHAKIALSIAYYNIGDFDLHIQYLYDSYMMCCENNLLMTFITFGKFSRSMLENLIKIKSTKLHTLSLENQEKLKQVPDEWINSVATKSSTFAKKLNVIGEQYLIEHAYLSTKAPITERERQVLLMTSQGMTRKEICDTMNISINTVKSLLNNVYSKLGAVNAPHAVRIAMQRGII